MHPKKATNKTIILVVFAIIIVGIIGTILALVLKKNTSSETTSTIITGTTSTINREGIVSLEIIGPEEEPENEQRTYAPAEVKEISNNNGTISLTLDMLSLNPDFQPGVTDYFLNKSTKIRTFPLTKDTKAYNCGPGKDGNDTSPDVEVSVSEVIAAMQQWITNANGRLTYFFDIKDGTINAIYQQCLP